MSKENENGLSEVPKISVQACQADLDKWFAHKRIRKSEREANQAHETNMLECMKEGLLTIDTETMEITYKLIFPLGETKKTTEIKLKSRIQVFERSPVNKKDPGDGDGRCAAVLGVLSGVNSNLILKFDPVDFGALQSIAIYFL